VAAAALLALLSGAGMAREAAAHGRSTSTSSWDLEPGSVPAARVQVKVQLSDLQRVLPGLGAIHPSLVSEHPEARRALDAYLTRRVRLFAGDTPCAVAGSPIPVPSADPAHVGRAWRIRCETAGPAVLHIQPFFEAVPGHLHLARLRLPDDTLVERIFVLDDDRFEPGAGGAAGPAPASSIADYVRVGIEHIATGADHLVFLLALLLVGVSFFEVATIVTGFTVAHSVTLALGVLGVVEPLPAAIEALIGLSIVVVALENFALVSGPSTRRAIALALVAGLAAASLGAVVGVVAVPPLALLGVGLFALSYLGLLGRVERPRRLRWFVAFVFGLVHGFGFAGLLTGIGLPVGRVAPALLGFNLGVELGQLVVVGACWPILHWILERGAAHRPLLVQLGSAPVLAAGLYWFIGRALV
jgi:hypothetical protein